MSSNTPIQWAHHTFNMWWGCYEQSPACDHCYARDFARRFGVLWGTKEDPRFASDDYWKHPLKWQRKAEKHNTRYRVFSMSMGDVMDPRKIFHPHRARLYELIAATPRLDWLLLTKQPKQLARLLPKEWMRHGCPPNVWLGVTAENPEWLARRAGYLLDVPASVRFLSMEPLLARTPLDRVKVRSGSLRGQTIDILRGLNHDSPRRVLSRGIDWVIVGGESGRAARPMRVDWAEEIIAHCDESGTPLFFKQWGSWAPAEEALLLTDAPRKVAYVDTEGLVHRKPPQGGSDQIIRLRSKKEVADTYDGVLRQDVPKQVRLVA